MIVLKLYCSASPGERGGKPPQQVSIFIVVDHVDVDIHMDADVDVDHRYCCSQ